MRNDPPSGRKPGEQENTNGQNNKPPPRLKLEFSKAADYDRINAAFSPQRLNVIDPHGYVAKRLQDDFKKAIDNGAAAFLSDESDTSIDNVKGVLFSYHYPEYNAADTIEQTAEKQKGHNKRSEQEQAEGPQEAIEGTHEYSEFGSAVSYLPGFGSAKLIMAALALKEWWHNPPSGMLFNEIENSNQASGKTYRDALKWEAVTDPDEIAKLFSAGYKNVTSDSGQGIGKPPPKEKWKDKTFYSFTERSLAIHARILLDYMDAGGIANKHSGEFIDVDFSALAQAGLTRKRIEALAAGETSRSKLNAMITDSHEASENDGNKNDGPENNPAPPHNNFKAR